VTLAAIESAALATREYQHGTRARYNAQRCRCFKCRRANAAYEAQRQADPRIDATPARLHLDALSSRGVGVRAVSDATDIPRVALVRIKLGAKKVRSSLAVKILAVDEQAIADHALVDATETQRLLRELVADGYTKMRLAAQLGSEARVPALQYKATRVLASTELRVRKLHAALLAEGDELPTVHASAVNSPRARILAALAWFDAVAAEDLFDAMDLARCERGAHMQALQRLVGRGVERLGDKPYLYRRAQ
jgi:hypothetical protein